MQKILLVEDEKDIAEVVTAYLEKQGNYSVCWAQNGLSALKELKTRPFDLVILDIMLPELDGLSVCREIRRDLEVPIIMLTALGEETDKVLGLELGADDYVAKPFSPRELLARVKAILRRTAAKADTTIQIDDVIINLHAYEVSFGSQPLDLTRSEFEILKTLAQSPGRVFTREQLLNAMQGSYFEAYERTIDAHIKNIRKKLKDSGASSIIKTVHGVGYKAEHGGPL